ncbi:hypothetical protein INT47_004265 [Mucor saturninus]|uniref:Peptidase S1 domain-containing protein n=1 Tax=Mucor saturninus TaxID=64648 RepID=A0A8H7V542_9FUNG|nr:hypothetical protein INT47_004265 [Mucor saturninus]
MYKRLLLFLSFPYLICAITGGNTVQSSTQYPFAVTFTNPTLCGGSIISLDPPWVLTAAHCVPKDDTNSKEIVSFGSHEFDSFTSNGIKKVIQHPLYISADVQSKTGVFKVDELNSVPYDIALVELKDPFMPSAYVNRIRLLVENEDVHLEGILETTGMGYTGLGETHAKLLQYAQCNSSNVIALTDDNFNNSVTLATSTAGLCHGDSGSPLIYKPDATSPEYYLKGILNRIQNAFDPEPENKSCPVHTDRTSTFVNIFVRPSKHIDWIMGVTGLSWEELTDTATNSQNRNTLSKSSVSSSAQGTYFNNGIISIFFLPLSILLIM